LSIAKVDVDIQNRPDTFQVWLDLRVLLIEKCGYHLVKTRVSETAHGYHVWFHLAETLEPQRLAELQFWLGDDQKRCKFNFMRAEAGVMHSFNALFNKKLKHKRKEMFRTWRSLVDTLVTLIAVFGTIFIALKYCTFFDHWVYFPLWPNVVDSIVLILACLWLSRYPQKLVREIKRRRG
jgi:hypothetical protein